MSICTVCSTDSTLMEFPTARELNAHIKGGHKSRPEDWKPRVKRITVADMEKKGIPLPLTTPETPSSATDKGKQAIKNDVKPIPIELQYHFIGMCQTCLKEVDTIMMEVGKSNRAIAYCMSCKKKLADKKVVPLT